MSVAIIPFIVMAAGAPVSPASVPAVISEDRAPNPWDNLAVPVLQVIGAEGIILLSALAVDDLSRPAADLFLVAAPVAVGLSTCGIGAASRRYRGSCWHSMLGVGAGLMSGLVIFALFEAVPGLNPVTPNQDDTQVFANTIGAFAFTVLIGIPGGSIVAWHIGKDPIPGSAVDQPVSLAPPARIEPALAPARSLSLRGDAPLRLIVPLVFGRF